MTRARSPEQGRRRRAGTLFKKDSAMKKRFAAVLSITLAAGPLSGLGLLTGYD